MTMTEKQTAPLAIEIETYNQLLPGLLDSQGKFVLIKGTYKIGIYDSYQDAIAAGYGKFALEPFLIKQIAPAEQVSHFGDLSHRHGGI